MSTTSTLTAPAPVARAVPVQLPRHAVRVAAPALPRPKPMAEPDGLGAWRESVEARPVTVVPTATQLRRVIEEVRAGTSLPRTASRVRLPSSAVLDVVAALGSRMSQLNKRGPRASKVLSPAAAAHRGMPLPPGAHTVGLHHVVVVAEGWERTAAHRRDIHRAYAAVLLLDPALDERAIERYLAAAPQPLPLGYAHFAHLYAVATGSMPTLEGVSDDLDVKDAYVRAFDELSALVSRAGSAVVTLTSPGITPEQVLGLLQRCYWILPDARVLAGFAAAANSGDAVAASRLRLSLSNLGARLRHSPGRFFPSSLAGLDTASFRAAVATLGFHPSDLLEDGRSSVDSTDLVRAIETARANLVASDPTYAAAFTALAAEFSGVGA